MNETKLLNETLEVLCREDAGSAYAFLSAKWRELADPSAQVYNYLYCLSAAGDEREAALCHLEEAILKKGLWYRPEVFEDDDLTSLFGDPRFLRCVQASETRWAEAVRLARPLCTWTGRTGDALAVALHGNQQNAAMCREDWGFLSALGYQTEYIQSGTVDSAGLYRWEDEDPEQISPLLERPLGASYRQTLLCGFSAGCGELLKAVVSGSVRCDVLALASPWIPMAETGADAIADALKTCGTETLLLCGTLDEDCLPLAKALEGASSRRGAPLRAEYIDGLGHELPEDLPQRMAGLLG